MFKKSIVFILLIIGIISCSQKEYFYEKKEILALWDSLTIWYGLDINDSYPMQLEKLLKNNWYNYKIENAWISWNTSLDLLNRISNFDDTKYGIYLLNIWSNDGLRKLSLDDMKNNIQSIIDHIKSVNPESSIVLIWNKLPINFWINYTRNFSSIFKDLSDENYLYYYDFLLDWVYQDVNLNLSDLMHPNKDWYEIIAKNIFEFLKDENIIGNQDTKLKK